MSIQINNDKKDFVYLYINAAEYNSSDKQIAKEFLTSEGINADRLVSEGVKRIKKMQLLANAKRTEQEMENSESAKLEATAWVDQMLNSVKFSLTDLVQKEELSISFRNIESLSEEDIRNILIRHFTLKFINPQNKF